MTGQSARTYRERTGLAPTRRSLGRATLEPCANVVLSTPAITLPEHQLIENANGTPDAEGITALWPKETVSSHD